MNIKELAKRKLKLKEDITENILSFELETGLKVTGIDIVESYMFGTDINGVPLISDIQIEVKIP